MNRKEIAGADDRALIDYAKKSGKRLDRLFAIRRYEKLADIHRRLHAPNVDVIERNPVSVE